MKPFAFLRAKLGAGSTTCGRITLEYLRVVEEKKDFYTFLPVNQEKTLEQEKKQAINR